jgi:hypothetical protein
MAVPFSLVGVMSMLAAGAAVLGVVDNSHIPGAGQSAVAFVISSAQNTEQQRTADVVFSGSMSVDNHTIPVHGGGQQDFSQNAFSGTISMNLGGESFAETELVARGNYYLEVVVDGYNTSKVLTGKDWVDIPIPTNGSSSLGLGNVDPATQIKAIEQKGAKVKFIGTSVIDGRTVSEYSIVPSASEVRRQLQQEIASGAFPAGAAQAASSELKAIGAFTTYVWLDGSGLMRRTSVTIAGGTSGLKGRVALTFKNFGTPVRIAVPASSDVVSFADFLKAAAQQSTTQ